MIDSKTPLKPSSRVTKEIKEQLGPLFLHFYPTSEQYKAFLQDSEHFSRLLIKTGVTSSTVQSALVILSTGAKMIQNTGNVSMEEISKARRLLEALAYLSFIELAATPYIDLAILMLISKGRALHLAPDEKHPYVRHASGMKDLYSPTLSLYTKLDFLDSNQLTFFSKWVDRPLRNKIAHLDFQIDAAGDFLIKNINGKMKKINLEAKLASFVEYNTAVVEYVNNELRRATKSKV
jgi:hypothetical protein